MEEYTYLRYLQVINDLKKCGYKKDNCELNYKFLNNLQPEWKQYGTLMRQTKNLMDINIDSLYNIIKQNQGDVNDALGYKNKAVVVTSDPLALVAEKTKVNKRKEKVEVQSKSEESDDEDISDLKNITALLPKAFNRQKYYAKPTNNNLRISSAFSFANKKPEYVKLVEKKEDKKADEKKRDMSKVKCYNCKKERHSAKDCKKAKVKDYNYYKTKMLLAKKDSDEQVLLAEDQAWMESRYTLMFLIHSNEALEIKKFKRARENKIEFAYDYGNLNASYVNEKINFFDDYFQEIINPDFKKIDSSFQQTSSLKPYVPTVILEKIIIDLEDEVVSLLEKEKANLETIESLKSKGFKSSENAISESKNQSENDCQMVEKECHTVVNSKVIALGMFKLSVSQSVSPISMLCDLFDENNLFIFDDEIVKISPISKMPFRKKPCDSLNIVHICLWIIYSGYSKHMTGNRALLTNFVEKFLGTVRFGNNDFAVIAGVGKFYDKGLEAAFQKSACFVRNEDGVDLLTDDRSSNLYTIALNEVASNSSICLLAKASSSQSWLWH
nr:hypothetical protein [Tanacetum cinerariifolium]